MQIEDRIRLVTVAGENRHDYPDGRVGTQRREDQYPGRTERLLQADAPQPRERDEATEENRWGKRAFDARQHARQIVQVQQADEAQRPERQGDDPLEQAILLHRR